MLVSRLLTLLLCLGMTVVSFAKQPTNTITAACDFQDGKELSVRHIAGGTGHGKDKLAVGKLWMPGGGPMFLFTETELLVDNSALPAGAYSMYVIPAKNSWTLILNKNVTDADTYDEHQDLLRVPMQIGRLSNPEQFTVSLGHVAPKQCNMRIYYGDAGVWAEFKEK